MQIPGRIPTNRVSELFGHSFANVLLGINFKQVPTVVDDPLKCSSSCIYREFTIDRYRRESHNVANPVRPCCEQLIHIDLFSSVQISSNLAA